MASAADTVTANAPSAGVADEELRDPFLPLDADAKTNAAGTPTAEPKSADSGRTMPAVDPHSLIHVQGIVRKGDRVYALINGRMASRGDIINIQKGDTMHRFLVRNITDRKVDVAPVP
jgi:hypothetical protein